jgi:NitT/TauT family transport system permease protein
VTEIVAAFGRRLGTEQYWLDLGQSLVRILTGFVLAAIFGVVTGILLGRSAAFANVFGPLTELARPIPAIAIVPVAILLFPTDEAGIVFITFLAAYFPIMVSTRHAVRALPTIWEDAVRTLGGSRWDVLLRVVLPGIQPGVFSGLSVGIGVAWICVISAEMISGRLGVGYRTWQAYTILAYPEVFVGIITIGVLGFATSAAVELVGRRATRWLPRGQETAR